MTRGARHAKLVEFGTKPRDSHPGTPRRPFLFPSFEEQKARNNERIKRAVEEAIKKAAGPDVPSSGE